MSNTTAIVPFSDVTQAADLIKEDNRPASTSASAKMSSSDTVSLASQIFTNVMTSLTSLETARPSSSFELNDHSSLTTQGGLTSTITTASEDQQAQTPTSRLSQSVKGFIMTLTSNLPGRIASATFDASGQTDVPWVSNEHVEPTATPRSADSHTVVDALTSAGVPSPVATIVETVVEGRIPPKESAPTVPEKDIEFEQAKQRAAIEAIIRWIMEYLHLDKV